ncbi:GGDEF domain-containing protein [Roseibium litorale]|uniref:diguanylate cyclase n=1 Tax=Roseibium litorale TaxID=2803841 RepID=A0ABR9CGZ5_9HYPH|nr:GGDEF domain-containing protein [Roseibium litorale]MBD8890130.1 GGDEF domain-containing protein [Roseibium litorale]
MKLDVFTVFVFLCGMCFLAGCVIFMAWWISKSSRGLLLWSISFFLRGSALPLLMLRNKIPDFLSIDVANAVLMLGLGISWYGTRELAGQKGRVIVAIAPAVLWLLACQVPEFYGNTTWRVLFFAALSGVYSAFIGLEFLRSGTRSKTHGARLRKSLGIVFLMISVMYLLRCVAALYSGVPDNPMNGGNLVGITLFITLFWVVGGTVVWLAIYFEEYVLSLKHEAEHDVLTNCPNRRALMVRGDMLLAKSSGEAAGILVFDLDYFKLVNDTHGHHAGDCILREFALLMRKSMRSVDVFGRLGGEEFAAVLPGVSPARMEQIADRLRQTVEEHKFIVDGQAVKITTSIGMVHTSLAGHDLEALLMKADDALYQAKDKGRNRIVHWRSMGGQGMLERRAGPTGNDPAPGADEQESASFSSLGRSALAT